MSQRPPLLVRAVLREMLARALEMPKAVADIFIEFSAHVNRIDVRAYAGGWRRDAEADFSLYSDFDFADESRADEEAVKALAALDAFIAAAPGIAQARAEHDDREAQRERAAFGAAVLRYREAKEAGAAEPALRELRIACDTLMNEMKFGCRGGIWWNERHGTWGLGTLEEDDIDALNSGAVITGPHS